MESEEKENLLRITEGNGRGERTNLQIQKDRPICRRRMYGVLLSVPHRRYRYFDVGLGLRPER